MSTISFRSSPSSAFSEWDSADVPIPIPQSQSSSSSSSSSVVDNELESLSGSFASAITQLTSDSQQVRDDGWTLMRAQYEAIMKTPQWLTAIQRTAEILVETHTRDRSMLTLMRNVEITPIDEIATVMNITSCGTPYSFDRATKSVVLVGRRLANDIIIRDAVHVSRTHALLFINPQLERVLVVDVGGINGITTFCRSDATRALQSSTGKHRRVIEFGANERATLYLGSHLYPLTINAPAPASA